jgi:hypothetical protein
LNKLEEEPKDGAVSAGSHRRGPPTSVSAGYDGVLITH